MNSSVCFRCAFSRSFIRTRSSLKRSLYTTRVLKEESSADPPNSPDSSNVPAKAHRPRRNAMENLRTEFGASDIKPYTSEDKARLAEKYSPAQLAAIEAGEAAVSPEDIYEQGIIRSDQFRLEYQGDDLSKIMPVIDKPVIAPDENYDPKLRFKTTDEIGNDLAEWFIGASKDASPMDYNRFVDNMRLKIGKEEAERNPPSYAAPEIPKGIPALQPFVSKKNNDLPISASLRRLLKQTGLTTTDIRFLRSKVLVSHRVVNQTRLGKISSFYYLAVAGNGKGLLGIGEGKATESGDARVQAKNNAIRNMQPVPRYEQRTIFGDVRTKFGAVELELMTRPPGFGVRCQSLIFEICKCAGITDLAARVTRSRNPMNTVKATVQALMTQRIPDEVARGLGKKLVDVRKVYYGGNV